LSDPNRQRKMCWPFVETVYRSIPGHTEDLFLSLQEVNGREWVEYFSVIIERERDFSSTPKSAEGIIKESVTSLKGSPDGKYFYLKDDFCVAVSCSEDPSTETQDYRMIIFDNYKYQLIRTETIRYKNESHKTIQICEFEDRRNLSDAEDPGRKPNIVIINTHHPFQNPMASCQLFEAYEKELHRNTIGEENKDVYLCF